MLELVVVLVNSLILGVQFLLCRLKVVLLHLLVQFFNLLVLQSILLCLLRLLLELQVQRIHHFLLKLLSLFLMFAVRLHSDVEMIAGIKVIDPRRSIGLYLLDVLLVKQLTLHEPFKLLQLFSLLHRLCLFVQLLAV